MCAFRPRTFAVRSTREYENIRLAVGQLAAAFPSCVCAVALAGLLARTVRYLWNAIRGFIGIGCIYAIPPLV